MSESEFVRRGGEASSTQRRSLSKAIRKVGAALLCANGTEREVYSATCSASYEGRWALLTLVSCFDIRW